MPRAMSPSCECVNQELIEGAWKLLPMHQLICLGTNRQRVVVNSTQSIHALAGHLT